MDIAFPRWRIAVFVDGCFWHGCPDHGTEPRHNAEYWRTKIARNRQRDQRNSEGLINAGWTILRLWEHEPVEHGVASVHEAIARKRQEQQSDGL